MKKCLKILFWLFIATILWVVVLKYVPICYTPVMLRRSIEYVADGRDYKFRKQWKQIDEIDYKMVLAVVASEDNLFMTHSGFDVESMKKAYERSKKGKKVWGGSTISQQTAKNVFTFGTRTYFRKAVEAYFTFLIEIIWGKERIMEVYLNVIETGTNTYGVEAASNLYFNHSSKKMSNYEAALIAAALPSPRKYSVSNPGPYMRRRASQVQSLMYKIAPVKFE